MDSLGGDADSLAAFRRPGEHDGVHQVVDVHDVRAEGCGATEVWLVAGKAIWPTSASRKSVIMTSSLGRDLCPAPRRCGGGSPNTNPAAVTPVLQSQATLTSIIFGLAISVFGR